MIINYDLAPGVHQIEHAYTNCYLVEGDDGVTIVDAAFRSTGRGMLTLLAAIGRSVADIRAVLLTHGHFDHVGFARGLQRQLRTPVWIHPADRRLAEHPYRYAAERNRLTFPLSHPGGLPLLGSMVAAGALAVQGVSADHDYTDGQAIPVPGRPTALHLPGHTPGQCGFLLADRGVLFSGDALVTLDPYTGRRGPRLVARAATADARQARASLGRLRGCDAHTVLPGHGPAWTVGVETAVARAELADIG